MDIGTDRRDDPQVIDDREPLEPAIEPQGSDEPFGSQEAIDEARTARFAAMLAAVQAANAATVIASSVSLLVGIGIGIGIGMARTRR